jgi:hypothetical protein
VTPAQVEEAARRRYNAVNANFWVQDDVFKVIYEAEQILATEALCIEDTDTSITTVAGTRAYGIPSLVIAIKRIEYDGAKLQKIDFREDDALTLNNADAAAQGNVQYYLEFDGQIFLRPLPSAAETLTIYCYKEATLLTTASTTLSVPVVCHTALIDYVVAQMAAKDGNYNLYDRMIERWEMNKIRLKQWFKKRKRTDSFAVVKDEENLAATILGGV